MATILSGSYTVDSIETLANLIKDNAGFSSTDFSVSGIYDFIVNSNTILRLKATSTSLGFYTVANGTETVIVTNNYLSVRMVVTDKATAICIVGNASAAVDVTPGAVFILRAEATSTSTNGTDDILITCSSSVSAIQVKFFAPDMLAFNTDEVIGAQPNTSSLNTVLYKVSGNTTYFIPSSVYFIRATNANVSSNFYSFILNNKNYETVGYWALRDGEV